MMDKIPGRESGNPLDLASRAILVTGASSGIGRATAILLSRLGARLILGGRNRERLEETRNQLVGDGHIASPFDLEEIEGIGEWVRGIVKTAGKLHGLAHCAGIHMMMPLRNAMPAEAELVMRINWLAAFELAKAYRNKQVRATPARIVFVSSVAAIVGQPGLSAYSSSKGALVSLARSLAVELSEEGISVNCVTPGMVKGEMADRISARLTPEQAERIEGLFPLGLGACEDVAGCVAFLLAETGRWITGTSLVVDGGFSAGAGMGRA